LDGLSRGLLASAKGSKYDHYVGVFELSLELSVIGYLVYIFIPMLDFGDRIEN
jgi:hypothetical protein